MFYTSSQQALQRFEHLNGQIILLRRESTDHCSICPLQLIPCAICENADRTRLHVTDLYEHAVESARTCRQLQMKYDSLEQENKQLVIKNIESYQQQLQIIEQCLFTITNKQALQTKYEELNKEMLECRDRLALLNFQHASIGDILDVRDTVNRWLPATILQISDTQVFIHYNGYSGRWEVAILHLLLII